MLIETLGLQPLPGEGGFFRSTWRSDRTSAILFLLTRTDFSALHRLDREELWHYHAGAPVEHVRLDPSTGTVTVSRLGSDIPAGQEPQIAVPKGVWQGARLLASHAGGSDYALVGCTVSPPWEDSALVLAQREKLICSFPQHRELIGALTR